MCVSWGRTSQAEGAQRMQRPRDGYVSGSSGTQKGGLCSSSSVNERTVLEGCQRSNRTTSIVCYPITNYSKLRGSKTPNLLAHSFLGSGVQGQLT